MQIEYLPLLHTLRELYALPRDRARFERYLALMLGGTSDIALPLAVANPMAKEHAAARLDELLALGADEIGAEAAADAEARLAHVAGSLKVALVLVDDAQGGWTNRTLTDAAHRFGNEAEVKRGFATGYLWTGERQSADQIRQELQAAIYRFCFQRRHGWPKTLAEMLVQEGCAAAFAGITPALGRDALATARAVIMPHRDSTSYPVQIACLYGDEAARSVGYPPLGVPAFGGFALSTDTALRRRWDPLAEHAAPAWPG